jgi:hypothetical protein
MTDPPLQVWTRYIAIDIHKHYLMIGGIDAHKRIVLQPRKVELQPGENGRRQICFLPMQS